MKKTTDITNSTNHVLLICTDKITFQYEIKFTGHTSSIIGKLYTIQQHKLKAGRYYLVICFTYSKSYVPAQY